MKRVFVFVLCLLLLYTTALAENYEGIDPFYLEREFDHWNLSETYRESEDGLEIVIYADAKYEKRAVLGYYGDAVCMAFFTDVTYDSKYLEQMFQATLAGEPAWIQVIASISYEAHMPTMEYGDPYEDTLGDMHFQLSRGGNSGFVSVEKNLDMVRALLAQGEASTPQPTAKTTPTPTPVPVAKPGIDGSNAYDILISSVCYGLNMGIRQETDDGYAWLVNSETEHGLYTISLDATEAYEISYASFAHSGSDDEFFAWAITMGYNQANIDEASAWIRACQDEACASTITIGDAIWTYQPHAQRDGGVLTLKDIDCDAYTDYLLDHIGE